VPGRLRTMHNEELHDLYALPSRMIWAGHVLKMGEGRIYVTGRKTRGKGTTRKTKR
jgi:hypothetical protein